MPATIRGSFRAPRRMFQQSLANEPVLILSALARGLHRAGRALRELHPPDHDPLDAALGRASARCWRCCCSDTEFSIIALIGVILLIGIVKKNAIMMIDFALDARAHARPESARGDLRGRAAALPPDHDDDDGGDARRAAARRSAAATAPSCASRSGSRSSAALLVSQILTLYTTPVMYLYLDRFGRWCCAHLGAAVSGGPPAAPAARAPVRY